MEVTDPMVEVGAELEGPVERWEAAPGVEVEVMEVFLTYKTTYWLYLNQASALLENLQ